jgi:hypothetical protein
MDADSSLTYYQTGLRQLLGKRDNHALRPADVGLLVRIFILYFTDERAPVNTYARNDSVNMLDDELYATKGLGCSPAGLLALPDRSGRMELV